MLFQKKTSIGQSSNLIKLIIKILILALVLFIGIILVDKVDFPSPYKKIEKTISDENFKALK